MAPGAEAIKYGLLTALRSMTHLNSIIRLPGSATIQLVLRQKLEQPIFDLAGAQAYCHRYEEGFWARQKDKQRLGEAMLEKCFRE